MWKYTAERKNDIFLSHNCSLACKVLSINLPFAFSCVCAACGLSLLKKIQFCEVQATSLQLSPYLTVISKAGYQVALNYGGITSLKGIL